ncbi:MAG: YggT family protein [Lysobacteraceae bacterium]
MAGASGVQYAPCLLRRFCHALSHRSSVPADRAGLQSGQSAVFVAVLLPLVHANFYNPISQTIYRSTQRVLAPLRRVLRLFGQGKPAVLIVFLLQMLKLGVLFALRGQAISAGGRAVLALAESLSLLVSLYFWMTWRGPSLVCCSLAGRIMPCPCCTDRAGVASLAAAAFAALGCASICRPCWRRCFCSWSAF